MAGASATSVLVPALQQGVSYTFRVTASNGIGASPESAASTAVVPFASLLDAGAPSTPILPCTGRTSPR